MYVEIRVGLVYIYWRVHIKSRALNLPFLLAISYCILYFLFSLYQYSTIFTPFKIRFQTTEDTVDHISVDTEYANQANNEVTGLHPTTITQFLNSIEIVYTTINYTPAPYTFRCDTDNVEIRQTKPTEPTSQKRHHAPRTHTNLSLRQHPTLPPTHRTPS